jgi:hypothetical protein
MNRWIDQSLSISRARKNHESPGQKATGERGNLARKNGNNFLETRKSCKAKKR